MRGFLWYSFDVKRKTKYLIGLIIIVIAIAAVIAALFLIPRTKKNQDEAVPTPMPKASQTGSPQASTTVIPSNLQDNWKLYNNSTHGFQIKFSDIWQGYQTQETQNPKPQILSQISFDVKTTDKQFASAGGLATPLNIYVYSADGFNESLLTAFPQTKVGECKGYVFTYSTWEEPPSDLQGLTDKEIADTLKSFKTSCL